MKDFEIAFVKQILERARWNVSQAARNARMNRQHLIRIMKRHGIK